MWNRRSMLRALAAAIAVVCCACGGTPTAVEPQSPGDTTPTRVVVLDPGIAEVFIHLELTDQMAGRPDYTDHLKSITHIPTMGTGITPQYERIVRADPDLILTTGSRGKVLGDLQNIAPTNNHNWLKTEEVVSNTRAIGALMGKAAAADALADRIAQGLTPTTTTDSPRVLILLGAPSLTASELWYAKSNSLHGSALQAAGGHNAIPDEVDGPPSLSIEALLKIDPDIILIMTPDATSTDTAAHMSFWERFPMLAAVQHKRIDFLTGREHYSTGPGVIEFKRVIHEAIERLQGSRP